MGPWTNMTPPIRGGFHHEEQAQPPAVVLDLVDDGIGTFDGPTVDGDGLHYRISRGRNTGFLDAEPETDNESVVSSVLRTRGSSVSPPPSSVTSVSDLSDALPPKCPVKFIDWAIDQGVEKAIRDYPSLDMQTQQAIALRYRQLHQTIIDDGLYECRYIEYFKELARYTTLFTLFAALFYNGWTLTSAVFLGMFWVCLNLPSLLIVMKSRLMRLPPAPNYVHGSRCGTPCHHTQLCRRYPDRHLHC